MDIPNYVRSRLKITGRQQRKIDSLEMELLGHMNGLFESAQSQQATQEHRIEE